MSETQPAFYSDVEECTDRLLAKLGKQIVLGLPLGLGKPNHLVNAIYRRAKADSSIELTICTALSLERPSWSNDLERRFLEPFVERVFGGYVDLDYMADLRHRRVPANVTIKEFYCKAGAYLGLKHAQQNYTSSNYTHVYRDILDSGVNLLAQQVCKRDDDGRVLFSLSCNPDVTLDIARAMKERRRDGRPVAVVAQVNQNLPFMYGDAVVEPGFFDLVIDDRRYDYRLFGAPKMAITTTDFWIGLYGSALIRDGGTLQIGIGSLGDALCYGLQLRHEHNSEYRKLLEKSQALERFGPVIEHVGGLGVFEQGLLGSTEMLVDGYLHLMNSGVIKRKSYDDLRLQRLVDEGKIGAAVSPATLDRLLESGAISPQLDREQFEFLQRFGIFKPGLEFDAGWIVAANVRFAADLSDPAARAEIEKHCLGRKLTNGILIHGGFFLGPESFYDALRRMSEEQRRQINMTSVLNVNQLYENTYGSEELRVLQRRHGRFVNACLMVTLSGNVVSDGLESGQMVSGVGGQYNFVSQAHALPDGRSVIMCKSTRAKGKQVSSNIVYNYGHVTVPRHLRDLIISEYGIADLRGKSDHEIIEALLNITDSRFQQGLLEQAKQAGKISDDYQIPERYRNNTPERLAGDLAALRGQGFFPAFPYGTDFSQQELVIGKALKALKARMARGVKKVSSFSRAATIHKVPDQALPYLERLGLAQPSGAKEKMMQKLVIHALSISGAI